MGAAPSAGVIVHREWVRLPSMAALGKPIAFCSHPGKTVGGKSLDLRVFSAQVGIT